MNYKLLGRSGLRVSELCFGVMTFGTEWGFGADKAESKQMFDLFLEQGGNFIDTANRYTEGTSETWLGEFVKTSGRRDELVIATKYALHTRPGRINDGGNHRKNLIQSVEGSLQRLQTDCIDVLYLHVWDFTTPIDEIMRGLDDLVRSGKVMYIAISDTPAWIVSRGQTIAELRGWSPFIGMQLEYSLIKRDAERDLLPMAKELGIGVTAWGAIGGGALTGKYLNDDGTVKRLKEGSKRLDERNTAIAKELVAVSKELGYSPSTVAYKWTTHAAGLGTQVIPVLGARNCEQLSENMKSASVIIPDEMLARLDAVSKIDLGFPHEFLKEDGVLFSLHGGLKDKIEFR